MTPKQRLIEAFKALCEREGGHVNVADEIGANEQNLWQILAGIKLPSGEPRGVGPNLQRKLEERYPGWSTFTRQAPLHADTLEALARVDPETRMRIENAARAMMGIAPLSEQISRANDAPRKRASNGG